jgi:transcription termination/antitermination protein NusG
MPPESGATEGGEALAQAAMEQGPERTDAGLALSRQSPWHVLWTNSHCEQIVCEQLAARGFHPFLPRMATWSVRAGRRHQVQVPMFPGYVFLNDVLDRAGHIEARKTRGVVRVLGDGWERPAVVPEAEIESLRRLAEARLSALPHPFLREGQRVRLTAGPLAGLEGILVKARPEKGLLVLSVNLLQRSVATEVDWTHVGAA